jgi:hypothetical protein
VKQRRGVIPRRVVARLCCVRALNARTRAGAGALVRDPRARRGPSSEADFVRRGREPSSEADLLEGAPCWAALVGRGGYRGVGCAACVCFVSGSRCVLRFLQVLSRILLGFLGTLRAVPDTYDDKHVIRKQ